MFPLQDTLVRFFLEAGVDNIVAKTLYSAVLTQTEVLRSSEIDWNQLDYPGCYSYEYRAVDVREVLPTERGGRNYVGSKPRAREGVKVVNLSDSKAMFDEKERVAKARLEKAQNVMPDNPSQETAGKEVSIVVVEGQLVVRSTVVGQEEDGKSYTIDSPCRQSDANVRAAIRESHKVWAARRSNEKPATIDAPTDVAGGGKGAAFDVSEDEGTAKDRSGLAHDSDAPVFRRAHSAQATGDLESVWEGLKLWRYLPSRWVALSGRYSSCTE